MTFDYVAVDGLPFVVDLKADTTKIADRYTPRYRKLEDSSTNTTKQDTFRKRRSNERHWL